MWAKVRLSSLELWCQEFQSQGCNVVRSWVLEAAAEHSLQGFAEEGTVCPRPVSLTPYLLGGKMAVLTPHSQQLSWPDNNACLLLTAAGIVQRWERWIQRQEAVPHEQWNVCEVPPLSSDKTHSKHMISQHHHHSSAMGLSFPNFRWSPVESLSGHSNAELQHCAGRAHPHHLWSHKG